MATPTELLEQIRDRLEKMPLHLVEAMGKRDEQRQLAENPPIPEARNSGGGDSVRRPQGKGKFVEHSQGLLHGLGGFVPQIGQLANMASSGGQVIDSAKGLWDDFRKPKQRREVDNPFSGDEPRKPAAGALSGTTPVPVSVTNWPGASASTTNPALAGTQATLAGGAASQNPTVTALKGISDDLRGTHADQSHRAEDVPATSLRQSPSAMRRHETGDTFSAMVKGFTPPKLPQRHSQGTPSAGAAEKGQSANNILDAILDRIGF